MMLQKVFFFKLQNMITIKSILQEKRQNINRWIQLYSTRYIQESLANAKVSARQQRVYTG